MDNNVDNGSNNGSIYGKFRERLRNIKLLRSRKKEDNTEFVEERIAEIKEVIGSDNSNQGEVSGDSSVSEVVKEIRATSSDRNYVRPRVIISDEDEAKMKDDGEVKVDIKVVNGNDISDVVNDVKLNKPSPSLMKKVYLVPTTFDDLSNTRKQDFLHDLGTEIINKIKGSFEDKLDELDVLESELFILSNELESELSLKKVKEIKERINELIDKINGIIDQYNLYKSNYYIENVVGIDDSVIVDDIINYRSLLDGYDDEKRFVKEYKMLEEFKALYDNLVVIKKDTEEVQKENEDKIEEYQIRDKKYDNIRKELVVALDIDKRCEKEIERQNSYFKDLMSKVSVINKEEYVTTHLRGIGDLIGSSLRYVGALLISPLAGFIPGITMQTLAARRMICNAYSRLHFEDVNHVYYNAVNYDSELNSHLTDVRYAEDLISDTLKDVDRLKTDFMSIYNSNIPGYEDTLKKINKIEDKLIRNQNKVSIIKKNLKASKKLNDDKLVRVRELNNKQNEG